MANQRTMIGEQEARIRILENITALPERTVPLATALGCFSARTVTAGVPLPAFDNSAMDGYAVVANSCRKGASLRVIGEQPAGPDRKLLVRYGEAIRIFTGAPLPKGADAIVMQEDVMRAANEITLNVNVETGDFVRQRGCDLAEGQIIVQKGAEIRVVTIALLASQGFAEVSVGGELTAGVISTGDELVDPGQRIGLGQIYDSNSALVTALLQRCHARAKSVEHCRDDRARLTGAIKRGIENHVLIITGGVSVGEHDLVKESLRQLRAEMEIWRVSIKPGKPFLFGTIDQCLIFGLPGNPVSAFVTFLQFVRPAILKKMGAANIDLPTMPARLIVDLVNDSERPHYIRGTLENGKFAPIGRQKSHALFGLSQSNALLRIGVGESLKTGQIVDVQTWNW